MRLRPRDVAAPRGTPGGQPGTGGGRGGGARRGWPWLALAGPSALTDRNASPGTTAQPSTEAQLWEGAHGQ